MVISSSGRCTRWSDLYILLLLKQDHETQWQPACWKRCLKLKSFFYNTKPLLSFSIGFRPSTCTSTCTCTHVAEVAVMQHKHSFARSLACRFRFVVKKIAYSFTLSVPLLYHTASYIVKNVACDSRLWSARLFKPVRRLRGVNLTTELLLCKTAIRLISGR